ncbi:MAG: squalene/phytoene synthase family protein [Ectothiorhodospiraceae bacterium]|nr:squalene/phytoene synthase family protein [Ectothiorhodospiraceae bacterium]
MKITPTLAPEAAEAEQNRILPGVSRTFALTIPQLPEQLRPAITNAYLWCRTADTVEDSTDLPPEAKRRHYQALLATLDGHVTPDTFARDLLAETRLALSTERELVERTPEVLAVYLHLPPRQQASLRRCLGIMCEGMARFETLKRPDGLPDRSHFRDYCYVVAGVVGEMLTDLFCQADPAVERQREKLMPLALGFGQGLQMTNILKDVWEDRRRGVCWLPRDLLEEAGCRLDTADHWCDDPAFRQTLQTLVGVAFRHLMQARDYTLAIPVRHRGIRRFCGWAIGMALYTLRNIRSQPDFRTGRQVKISRQRLRAVIIGCNLAVGHNGLTRAVFSLAARGLTHPGQAAIAGLAAEERGK